MIDISARLLLSVVVATLFASTDAAAQSTPLPCGDVVQSELTLSGEQDTYTFTAQQGDIVSLVLWDVVSGVTFVGDLMDPTGASVLTGFQGEETVEIDDTGEYTVVVRDSADFYTGGYSIVAHWLYPLGSQCSSARIVCGGIVQSSLATTAEQDFYTFTGEAGDLVSLTAWSTTSGIAIVADVFAPTSSTTPWTTVTGQTVLDLPESGTYTVRVRETSYYYAGNYTIGIEWIAPQSSQCGVQALACDTTVSGALTTVAQQDFYSFEGTAGDWVSLTVWQTTAGVQVFGDLFGPSSGATPLVSINGELTYELPETGSYSLRVRETSFFYSSNYSVGLEWLSPLVTVCGVQPIACGETISGAISATAEQDYFSFEGVAGQVVMLTVWETTAGIQIYGDVYAPSSAATPLVPDARGPTTIELPETGTYTIRVHETSFFYLGSYWVGLEHVYPHDTICDVEPILCGGSIAGAISGTAVEDYYSFEAQAGDVIELVLWETTSGVVVEGEVFGPSSVSDPLFVDVRGPTTLTLPESGTYYVRVHDSSHFYSLNYWISLEWVFPHASQCDVQPIACGESLSGAISSTGERDIYSFEGQAGDVIELVLWETTSGVVVEGEVFGPSSVSDPLFVDVRGPTTLTLPESGTYYVRVHDSSHFYSLNYWISLEWVFPHASQCDVQPITCGESLSGAISSTGERDIYSFEGQAGDVIELVLWETTSGVVVEGEIFGPGSVSDPLFVDVRGPTTLTLPESGMYYVRVHDSSHFYSLNYWISLEWVFPHASQCDVQPIACGESLSGAISSTGERDIYSFEGQAGDVIELVLWETTSGVVVEGEIFGPGSVSAPLFVDLRGPTTLTLPESGTYYVRVHDSSHFYALNYWIGLEWLYPLSGRCQVQALSCGQSVSAAISSTTEQDLYAFQGIQGDVISLVVWETTAGIEILADVYGPTSSTTPAFPEVRGETLIELPESGTFTVRVRESSYYYSGNYWIGLEWIYPTASQCDVTFAPCAETISGQISATTEQDFFGFTASEPDVASIVLTSTASGFSPRADLFGPDSPTIPIATDLVGAVDVDLPTAGRYTLRVREASFYYGGSYDVSIELVNGCQPEFVRGDANLDGDIDIADAIAILGYLFLAEPGTCDDAMDANGSNSIGIGDPIFLSAYLFQTGSPPPSPFPMCGTDGGVDSLGCDLSICP